MSNLELENAHDIGGWAWDFLQTTFNHVAPAPTSKHLMEAACRLASTADVEYDADDAHQQRVAYVLAIDAALTDPEAVIRCLRYARERLVKEDPALGVIGGK